MNRAAFLTTGVKGGAAVAIGGMTAGLLAAEAPAAGGRAAALSDLDLAIARQAVAAEILAIEFYSQAIASKQLGNGDLKYLRRAQFNEQEHLEAVSDVLTAAGQTPSTSDDFTITFPKDSFATPGSIAKLGVTLETGFVGAYLGAVDGLGDAGLKTTAARIAASESQHLSVFSDLSANRPVGLSFPAPLGFETVSDFLDTYLG